MMKRGLLVPVAMLLMFSLTAALVPADRDSTASFSGSGESDGLPLHQHYNHQQQEHSGEQQVSPATVPKESYGVQTIHYSINCNTVIYSLKTFILKTSTRP